MSLHPGKQITESLRLVRLVGRGAMGSVWIADHLGLQSQVAVKFMAPAMLDDPVSAQRFRLEAKAAAEIKSPHVAQVFDHGQAEDGQLYIVMELLEGESLERRIRRQGPLASAELAALVAQAAKALAKAHERGIVHRDIKPANVFLLADGELFVKLLDFGVAKFSGQEAVQMTAAGNMVGTPAFMSPEQLFHGQDVDHRGDLWSLAVVAYYALTGSRPFEGKTLGELCVAIKRGQYTAPTRIRSELNPALDAWFARAFHPDLEARFKSAKEMARELEAAVGAATILSSTPSGVMAPLQTFTGTSVSSHPALPAPRSRRAVIVVGALAALTSGGALAFLLTSGASAPSSSDARGAPAPSSADAAPFVAAPSETPRASPGDEGGASAVVELEEVPVEETSPSGAPSQRDGSGAPAAAPRSRPAAEPAPGEDERSKRAAETLGI